MHARLFLLSALSCGLTVAASTQEPARTYFEFQVSKPVRPKPGSVAPRYPVELRATGVEGEVLAQFIVDSLGVPVMASFRVLRSSHANFTEAVKVAVAETMYEPAELNGRKVRQLVQQPFVFALSPKGAAATGSPGRAAITPGARGDSARELLDERLAQMMNFKTTPAPRRGQIDGWRLTQAVTIDSGTGSPPRQMTIRFFHSAFGSRREISSIDIASAGPVVMLMDSSGKQLTMLLVARKLATVSRLPMFQQMLGVRDAYISYQSLTDLGTGEHIGGEPTRRFLTKATSGMTLWFDNRQCTIEQPLESEVWTVDNPTLRAALDTLAARSKALANGMLGTTASDQRVTGERPPGAIMRTVSHPRRTLPDGTVRTTTITAEVTEFFAGPLDAAFFDPPEGYRLMDVGSSMSTLRMDSISQVTASRIFGRMVDSTPPLPGETRRCVTQPAP
jgi:hypothetical protein